MAHSPPIRVWTEPCGCIITTRPGHVHTKMCAQHHREYFAKAERCGQTAPDNLDLIGG